jgi:hypothetical protein
MTSFHITDSILWFERNGVRDDEAYDSALRLLQLHENFYISTDEWEMLWGMVYDYETNLAGDFE